MALKPVNCCTAKYGIFTSREIYPQVTNCLVGKVRLCQHKREYKRECDQELGHKASRRKGGTGLSWGRTALHQNSFPLKRPDQDRFEASGGTLGLAFSTSLHTPLLCFRASLHLQQLG